jgi:hypothetical protein
MWSGRSRVKANTDLQTRTVFDLTGDQSRDGTISISRFQVRQLRGGRAVGLS